jgi:hypothetical protein
MTAPSISASPTDRIRPDIDWVPCPGKASPPAALFFCPLEQFREKCMAVEFGAFAVTFRPELRKTKS